MNIKFIAAAVAATLLFSGCLGAENKSTAKAEVTGGFYVETIGVGKADCILLKNGGHAALIDTGTEESTKTVLDYLSKEGITSLDYLIITHFDKDHVGGADGVIKSLDVKNVLEPNYKGDSADYSQYVRAMAEKGISPETLSTDADVTLGDVKLKIDAAKHNFEYGRDNDFSLVISAYYGENSFLFAGDAEKLRINELLNENIGSYDFLKVPHHGIEEKNSAEFFEKVKPKIAVITCSKSEPADESVIDELKKDGCEVYTVQSEAAVVFSDGKNVSVK